LLDLPNTIDYTEALPPFLEAIYENDLIVLTDRMATIKHHNPALFSTAISKAAERVMRLAARPIYNELPDLIEEAEPPPLYTLYKPDHLTTRLFDLPLADEHRTKIALIASRLVSPQYQSETNVAVDWIIMHSTLATRYKEIQQKDQELKLRTSASEYDDES
jgi:hypothetical protein